MLVYFLDDERRFYDVTWVDYPDIIDSITFKDPLLFVNEVVSKITEGNCDNFILSFDHDLQYFKDGLEITGYDAIKMLVDRLIEIGVNEYQLPKIYYHSKNPVGVENMSRYWDSFIKHKTQS